MLPTQQGKNADGRQSQSLSNIGEFPPLSASNGASPIIDQGLTCNKSLTKMTSRKSALNLMKTATIRCKLILQVTLSLVV